MKKYIFLLNLVANWSIIYSQIEPRLVLPVGHLGGVTKLDSSPNEKLLLTEDLNSDIIIIDSDKLIELQRHYFEGSKITSSTFLNDSSVISICNDTLVAVWNFYSDKVDLYSSVPLNKVYVENHGLYCIDKHGVVFSFEISEKDIVLNKFIKEKATEVYFKSKNEIFLVNGNNLMFVDLNRTNKLKRQFDNEITALATNTNGNVLLGFKNGEILECNSRLTTKHIFKSISDRISVATYLNDSMIISGSYDYSVVSQNKNDIVNSVNSDDWIVGMSKRNKDIIICSWNGTITRMDENFKILNEFQTDLRKATFFCQKGKDLYLAYNDGSIGQFDIRNFQLQNNFHICSLPIIGIDINNDGSESIIWNSNGLLVYNLVEKAITVNLNNLNISSARYIPSSDQYIFCSEKYLFYTNQDLSFDSIPLYDSWEIYETNESSLIVSGLNRIIELNSSKNKIYDLSNLGLIWVSQKSDDKILLGTSRGNLIMLDSTGMFSVLLSLPMGINGIEKVSDQKVLINCENGQLILFDIKTKKTKLIADTKQEYGSWDFKYNPYLNNIIFPNSCTWDLKMDVDVLDLNGNKLNSLKNVGSEVVCVPASYRSIEFNQLDSNQVCFIQIDGAVKLWDINTDGNDPITQLGFDYYNLLKDELHDFNIKGAFLKSGLLKLPIPGVDTLTFMNLKNGDWLVHDSKYRFDGTPGAIEKLYFTCGLEIVELNQVKDSLYVPNLIQRYTNGEKLEHIPQIKDLQICGYTPLIEIIDSLHYKIIPRNGGVGEIAVYINGIQRLTYTSEMLRLENGIYELNLNEAEINPFREIGKSMQIKVVAKTADNSVSSRGVVVEIADHEKITGLKPSIHAIMIGVDNYEDKSLQLKYAAKDANDLQVALQLAAENYFNVDDTNRVFFYNLTINSENKSGTNNIRGITPDRGNIISTLKKIEKTSKPEDIFLLFFAGHGEIVDNEQLLLLTTESTRDNFQGIKMNELLSLMNKIPAGKRMLILDACHSGAAINNLNMALLTGKRDVKDAEWESQRLKELDKLANKSGFAIITASSSDEKALELPQYEHGLLTYSLLCALVRDKSILTDENQIVTEKWFIAAEEEMKKLNKNQNAEKMVPVSFNIGVLNEVVINSVDISQIPTLELDEVINVDQFLRDAYPLDNLGIRQKLSNAIVALNQSQGKQVLLLSEESEYSDKLIVKYVIAKDQIELKCQIVKNGIIFLTINKVFPLDQIDRSINDLINEIQISL